MCHRLEQQRTRTLLELQQEEEEKQKSKNIKKKRRTSLVQDVSSPFGGQGRGEAGEEEESFSPFEGDEDDLDYDDEEGEDEEDSACWSGEEYDDCDDHDESIADGSEEGPTVGDAFDHEEEVHGGDVEQQEERVRNRNKQQQDKRSQQQKQQQLQFRQLLRTPMIDRDRNLLWKQLRLAPPPPAAAAPKESHHNNNAEVSEVVVDEVEEEEEDVITVSHNELHPRHVLCEAFLAFLQGEGVRRSALQLVRMCPGTSTLSSSKSNQLLRRNGEEAVAERIVRICCGLAQATITVALRLRHPCLLV